MRPATEMPCASAALLVLLLWGAGAIAPAHAGNWGERWGVLHWGAAASPPAPPDAPVIAGIEAGFGEITVTFTDGNDDGGSPITGYTVSCGGFSASGPSPVTVSGLDPYVAYDCTVVATNAEGDSLASAAVSGTPLALRRLNIPLIKAAIDARDGS